MSKRTNRKIEAERLEIDGVPTVAGLVKMKLANPRQVRHGKSTHTVHHISDEGHALLGRKLREKAQRDLAAGVWSGISGSYPGPPPQPKRGEVQTQEEQDNDRTN